MAIFEMSQCHVSMLAWMQALFAEDTAQSQRLDAAYAHERLDLPRIQRLVALHGGQMRVYSQPGEGTVVTFTLPVYDATLHTDRHAQPERQGTVGRIGAVAPQATCALYFTPAK